MSERIALLALALSWLAASASAADLVDPTRPPVGRERDRSAADANSGWVLTSVLVSPERRLATIDGRRVRVGDRLGEAQVVAISLAGVRLAGPEGVVDLPLVPPLRLERTEEE